MIQNKIINEHISKRITHTIIIDSVKYYRNETHGYISSNGIDLDGIMWSENGCGINKYNKKFKDLESIYLKLKREKKLERILKN